MSFRAVLDLGDRKEISILECSYGFNQDVDNTGKAVSRPQGGTITLVIESTNDTDMLSWMLGHEITKNGTISFFKSDNESALKKLEFTDAICVGYQETFGNTGDTPMLISLTLSARIIKVGNANHENFWAHVDGGG